MRIKFDPNLDFQDEAISSVIDIFKGQEASQSLFTVSAGAYHARLESFNKIRKSTGYGIGNRLDISEVEILSNLQEVQLRNGLPKTHDLHSQFEFDVEMETGTGKTYVYTKSILRLNEDYGFTKFIIVVPSIAIKEGVYKSLKMTEEHFKDIFNGTPYNYFVYDSSKLEQVRDFAVSSCVQIMVINIDAFRKSFEDPNKESSANIIHRPNDRLSGMKPIDLIRETNPIVIIDEPQSVTSTAKAEEAIDFLNPLCRFNYSATHIKKHNIIYRLDAVDAYDRKLVKGIDVAGFSSTDQHNAVYIKLISVDNTNSPITAKIEVDSYSKNGNIERKIIKVKKNDDMSEKTKRSIYEGYFVDEINCTEGREFIHFTPSDVSLRIGESVGDVDDSIVKRKMISKTIQEHLDREIEHNAKGIKVLSLFFIDRVANYRDGGEKGPYAKMFEEEYAKLIRRPKYEDILNGEDPSLQASQCHDGYFSGDKSGWKDTKGSEKRDNDTYNLIMKDKERLLSMKEKLRFIFSHSALREGWDNPNIFQICTLNETKSEIKKRQELGRGLRLCVDQSGQRIHDPLLNQLTVMANESYEDFAAKLQKEYEDDSGIRFGVIEIQTFSNMNVGIDGNNEYFGHDRSERVYNHFKNEGYIDSRGKIQDKFRIDLRNMRLSIPEEVEECRIHIDKICFKIVGRVNVKNNDAKRKIQLRKEILLSETFLSLWDKIKYKTKYNLNFNSEKLIEQCVKDMEQHLRVTPPTLLYNKAKININVSGVEAIGQMSEITDIIKIDDEYLPDIISYLQNRTDLTRKTIVSILTRYSKLDDFRKNPQMFMERSAEIINQNVWEMAKDGIKYTKLGDSDCYMQEIFEDEELFGYLHENMTETKKSVYEYTIYDSDVEKNFAIDLENNDRVKLFIKLPDQFKVSTPIGGYNPDWAVLMDLDGMEKLYFVFETKGNINNNRPTEEFKIHCGKRHFEELGVNYECITSLKDVKIGSWPDFP